MLEVTLDVSLLNLVMQLKLPMLYLIQDTSSTMENCSTISSSKYARGWIGWKKFTSKNTKFRSLDYITNLSIPFFIFIDLLYLTIPKRFQFTLLERLKRPQIFQFMTALMLKCFNPIWSIRWHLWSIIVWKKVRALNNHHGWLLWIIHLRTPVSKIILTHLMIKQIF